MAGLSGFGKSVFGWNAWHAAADGQKPFLSQSTKRILQWSFHGEREREREEEGQMLVVLLLF